MLESLVNHFVEAVFLALAGVLAAYAVAIAHKLAARFGLQLDAARDQQIEYAVRQAVMKAEELVAARLAAGLPVQSAQAKLELALTDLLDRIPGLSRERAIDLIHAALPQLGLGSAATASEAAALPKTGVVVETAPNPTPAGAQ